MYTEKAKLENRKRNHNQMEQIDLVNACSENVNSLVKCAKVLLDNNEYSKSFFMSYAALEELGKRLLVCDYITGIISESEFSDAFHDHNLKIAYLHNFASIERNDAVIKYDKSRYKSWFDLRNDSLYVNYLDGAIKSPNSIITEKNAIEIYQYVLKIIKETNYLEAFNGRLGSKAVYK